MPKPLQLPFLQYNMAQDWRSRDSTGKPDIANSKIDMRKSNRNREINGRRSYQREARLPAINSFLK